VRACRLLADFVEKVAWAIGQLPYLVFTMPELLYVVAKNARNCRLRTFSTKSAPSCHLTISVK
jgi:hypothetical protein